MVAKRAQGGSRFKFHIQIIATVTMKGKLSLWQKKEQTSLDLIGAQGVVGTVDVQKKTPETAPS